MAFYRKKLERKSSMTFVIEADTMCEAQEIFDQWCQDDCDNECELNQTLNERETDIETWVGCYKDLDAYDHSDNIDDVMITKPFPKEPKYDLYFSFVSGIRKAYLDCTMENVVEKIGEQNKTHILKRNGFPSAECFIDARKRKATVIWFECERRPANG